MPKKSQTSTEILQQRKKIKSKKEENQSTEVVEKRINRPWSAEESQRLRDIVKKNGARHWRDVAHALGSRSASQCSQHWRRGI